MDAPWTLDAESQVVHDEPEIAELHVVETDQAYGTHPVYQAAYDDDIEDEAASEPATDGAEVFEAFGPIVAEPIDVFVPYQHEVFEPEPADAEPEPMDVFVPYEHEPFEPADALTAPEPDETTDAEPIAAFVPYEHAPYE